MARKSSKPTETFSDTGIYQERGEHVNAATHDQAALKATWAELTKCWRARARTLDEKLALIEALADHAKASERRDVQSDAQTIGTHILVLRRAMDMKMRRIRKGDIRRAVGCGLVLGKLAERVFIKLGFEEYVPSGRKHRAEHLLAGQTNKARTKEKQATICRWIAARRAAYPDANTRAHVAAATRDPELKRSLGVKTLATCTVYRALKTEQEIN
jgi:hypothetical protein